MSKGYSIFVFTLFPLLHGLSLRERVDGVPLINKINRWRHRSLRNANDFMQSIDASCPTGYDRIRDWSSCRDAANSLGFIFMETYVSWPHHTSGCVNRPDGVYFNSFNSEVSDTWATSICEAQPGSFHPYSAEEWSKYADAQVSAGGEAGWCVLLTTTIRTQVNLTQWWANQQVNSSERELMYSKVVRKWATETSTPVILVENSGSPLDALRQQIPQERKDTFELVNISVEDSGCDDQEIGCLEGISILRALDASKLAPSCSHILKVTGRYFIRDFSPASIMGTCASRWPLLAVQNPAWSPSRDDPLWRQETQVLGFERQHAEDIFGWARKSETCMECHMSTLVRELTSQPTTPNPALCDLPRMPIDPAKEGSTGLDRSELKRGAAEFDRVDGS